MSGAVDTKTVEMRFDNQNFESNAKQSISTLEKLKSALKLDGASKGLSDIEKASKKLDFKDLDRSVGGLGKSFSALETIATGVFFRIGQRAADAGLKIVKSLTVDQMVSGWQKYEQETTAVQTIMNNLTEAEGNFVDEAAKMEYVEKQLSKLMWFADETSYGFTDMVTAMSSMKTAGQGLEASVTGVRGIALATAMAGGDAKKGARAMTEFTQAIQRGYVDYRDWQSIMLLGLNTPEFEKLAIDIAQANGLIKEGDVTLQNFATTLKDKWFTNDVMMELFSRYGEAADKIQEYAEKYDISARDAIEELEATDAALADSLAFRAFKAGQEAKTLSEALGSVTDAISTKFTKMYKVIFGNYLEQKELWGNLADQLYDAFVEPYNGVIKILQVWREFRGVSGIEKSGRDFLLSGFQNIMETFITDTKESVSLLTTFRSAFKEAFDLDKDAETLGKRLWDLTKRFKEFTERLKPSEETLEKIKNSFKGLFTLFKIGGKLVSAVVKPFKDLFRNIFKNVLSGVLDLADGFGSLIQNFDKFLEENKVFDAISNGISWGLQKIGEGLNFVSQMLAGVSFKEFFGNLKTKVGSFFTNLDFSGVGSTFTSIINQIKQIKTESLPEKLTPLQNFYIGVTNIFSGMRKFFGSISPAFKFIGEKINSFFESIGEAFANRKAGRSVSRFAPIWEGIKSIFSGIGDFFEKIGPTLGKVGNWLGEALGKLGEGIAKFTENKSGLEIVESILKGGFILSLTNLVNSIAGLNKGGKGILKSIAGDLDAIKGVLKAYQREINVQTLVDLALAMALLSGAMLALAQIPAEKMDSVVDALWNIAEVLAAFTIMKEVIKSLTKANAVLDGKDPTTLFGKIKSILTGVVSASIFANDASAKFVKISAGILLAALAAKKIAEAVGIIGESLIKLGKEQDDAAIKKGGKIVAQIVGVFAIFALLAGFSNKTGSSLAAALAAFIVVKAIAKLINLMAEIGADAKKVQNIKNFLGAFSDTFDKLESFILKFVAIIALAEVLMAAFSVGAEGSGLAATIKQFGKNFIRIAASLAIVAAAVWMISNIDYTPADITNCSIIFGGFILLVGILQAVMAKVANSDVGTSGKLPKILNTFGNNFIKIAASLLVVSLAVKMITNTPYTQGDIGNCSIIFGGFILLVGILQAVMAKVANTQVGATAGNPLAKTLKAFGNNFLKIAASLLIVALAVKLCAGIQFGEGDLLKVGAIFGGFLFLVGAIASLAIGLSTRQSASEGKIISAMASTAALMLAAAASLFLVEEAVRMMQGLQLSPTDAIIIGSIFGGFLLIVGLFATLAGSLTETWSGAVAIAALAGSYIAAAYSLQLLAGAFNAMKGMTDLGQLAVVAIIFAAFLGIVGGLAELAGEFVTNWQGVAAIAVVAGSYIAAAYSLQLLAGAFSSMQSVAESGNMKDIGGVFATFLIAVGGFGLLAGLVASDWSNVAGMAVMMLSYIAAAAAFQILAGAMNTLCQGTSVEQLHEAGEIMTAFLLLVGILGTIGGLLGAIGGVEAILGMAGIAGIIISIGVACLAAGAGIGLAAAGLGLLSAALAELVEALAIYGPQAAANVGIMVIMILTTIISAAPLLAQASAVLIQSFASGLIASANILAAAAFILLATLLDTFATGIPALADSIVNLITSAINTIAEVIRSSANKILPALMNVLSAVLELVLEVLAELVGTIPGVGSRLASEIRGWKGSVNEALTGVFSDANQIGYEGASATAQGYASGSGLLLLAGKEGADSVNTGFSGGGAGHSFEQTGDSAAEKTIKGYNGRFASHGKKVGSGSAKIVLEGYTDEVEKSSPTIQRSTDNFLDVILSSVNTGGVDVNSAFGGMLGDLTGGVEGLDLGGLFSGKMGDIVSSITTNGGDVSTSFSGILDGLSLDIEGFDLGGLFAGKMGDATSAIDGGKDSAQQASKNVAKAVEEPLANLDSYTWGTHVGEQFASGINAAISAVRAAATAMAGIVQSIIGFSEPDVGPLSDFHTYAPDMIKLWCSGIYSNLDKVENSSNAMADSVYDGFSTALEYVSDLIDNGMSDELAIRPVMDLSGIQNGIHNMGSLISGANGYTISGTARLASTTAYGMSTRMPTAAEQAPAVAGAGVNNYNTFNITNDDPQAVAQKVSRILDQGTRREQAVWAR